jgi:hypothetical protein
MFILGSFFKDFIGAQGIKLRLFLSEDWLTPLPAATKTGLVED